MNCKRQIYPYYIGVRVGHVTSLALWNANKKKLEKLTSVSYNGALNEIERILKKKDAQVRYELRDDPYVTLFEKYLAKNKIPKQKVPDIYVQDISAQELYDKTSKRSIAEERIAASIVLNL